MRGYDRPASMPVTFCSQDRGDQRIEHAVACAAAAGREAAHEPPKSRMVRHEAGPARRSRRPGRPPRRRLPRRRHPRPSVDAVGTGRQVGWWPRHRGVRVARQRRPRRSRMVGSPRPWAIGPRVRCRSIGAAELDEPAARLVHRSAMHAQHTGRLRALHRLEVLPRCGCRGSPRPRSAGRRCRPACCPARAARARRARTRAGRPARCAAKSEGRRHLLAEGVLAQRGRIGRPRREARAAAVDERRRRRAPVQAAEPRRARPPTSARPAACGTGRAAPGAAGTAARRPRTGGKRGAAAASTPASAGQHAYAAEIDALVHAPVAVRRAAAAPPRRRRATAGRGCQSSSTSG